MPSDLAIQAIKAKCTDAIITTVRSGLFSDQELKERIGELEPAMARALDGRSSLLNLFRILIALGHNLTITIDPFQEH